MIDNSILLILGINLAALLIVALAVFAWIKLKETNKNTGDDDNESDNKTNKKISNDKTSKTDKLKSEIAFLKKKNTTQQSRIDNLEKFRKLYTKTNDLIKTETKFLRQSLMSIINIYERKEDKTELLIETEKNFHSLKKINPLLEGVDPELFETKEHSKPVTEPENTQNNEKYSEQLTIIENLQRELSKSQESLEKLQYLKRLAKASSDQNAKLKIELLKAQSLAKNSRENQIKVKSLKSQLDALMKKEQRDSDEKVSLNRQIANMTDDIIAPTEPKDIEMGTYINSLVSDIEEKNEELEKSKTEYNKMEEEYNRLFYKLQDANASEDTPAEKLKSIRNQLREAEIKMNASGIEVKLAEGEVISLSNNCDEVISMQQKYNNLQKEYEMLAESIDNNIFSDENKHLQAKVKALKIENEELKEIEQKLSETTYELERARVEYSMLEKEFINLAEES